MHDESTLTTDKHNHSSIITDIHPLFQMLTSSAVDDFNRARKYLNNMAVNHGVPVYSTLTDAVHTAALKIKRKVPVMHSVIAEH